MIAGQCGTLGNSLVVRDEPWACAIAKKYTRITVTASPPATSQISKTRRVPHPRFSRLGPEVSAQFYAAQKIPRGAARYRKGRDQEYSKRMCSHLLALLIQEPSREAGHGPNLRNPRNIVAE